MTQDGEAPSLAVLIDADNTSARYAQAIFEEIVKLGEANVRRIYGDFSGSRLAAWDAAIQSLAILQHQQRNNTKGKNAADIALVIDAMDLLHKGRLEGVCLVSSDRCRNGARPQLAPLEPVPMAANRGVVALARIACSRGLAARRAPIPREERATTWMSISGWMYRWQARRSA